MQSSGKGLDALFLTPSQLLKVFHAVAKSLHCKRKLRKADFYLSDDDTERDSEIEWLRQIEVPGEYLLLRSEVIAGFKER